VTISGLFGVFLLIISGMDHTPGDAVFAVDNGFGLLALAAVGLVLLTFGRRFQDYWSVACAVWGVAWVGLILVTISVMSR
jgi:hypothetical protein